MNARTTPCFHPDQFMLGDYAAGSLHGAFALPLAVHLEYCEQCRTEAHQLEEVGARLFEDLDPVPVSDDAFDQVLRRIEGPGAAVPGAGHGAVPAAAHGLPRVLQGLVPAGLDALEWKRIGSLRSSRLRFGDPTREVALQHISAGGKVLEHGHRGAEITVVINGSFSDHDGCYRAGDFLVRGPEDVHRPVAAQDGDCLCLAVLEAPIRLEGWMGRLANPFLKIHPR
jgi:putative transcriptional regulator